MADQNQEAVLAHDFANASLNERSRTKDKADRATRDLVLDDATRQIIESMINKGAIDKMHGVISTGKEANVYGAVYTPSSSSSSSSEPSDGPDAPEPQPTGHRVVKIYKTSILVFKDRQRYIQGEHRFRDAVKGNNRKKVKQWAEKEFRNLHRIHDAGIPSPDPVRLKANVLVMGMLGDRKGKAYPRLKDTVLDGDDEDAQWQALYVQLLGVMRRLYQVCGLVHADLSEYNILYNNKTLYIIDVSQSVGPDHPRSLEFLRMDIKNVGDFFKRKGVDILSDRAVFEFIMKPEGPVEEPDMAQAIEKLYATRPEAPNSEAAAAELEIDNEVFRNSFIPQSLEQLSMLELDNGTAGSSLYGNLLAGNTAQGQPNEEIDGEVDESGSEGDSDSDDGSDSITGSDYESRFEKGTPRGKRFQDKEEKKNHKAEVKEAKREKRKEKMPKAVKKRIVSQTTRRHK